MHGAPTAERAIASGKAAGARLPPSIRSPCPPHAKRAMRPSRIRASAASRGSTAGAASPSAAQANRYLEWGGSTWQRIAGGNLVSISVGTDGTLWGVDANHDIFSFNGSAWQPVPGTMQKVSVGSAQYIAGLDPAGKLFYYDGSWQPIASPTTGPMLDVAIGSDASLFAIDSGHKLWSRIAPGDWAQIGAVPLQQIDAADRYHVCGITVGTGNDNNVWTGAGVMVGGDHHLRRYFRVAGVGT